MKELNIDQKTGITFPNPHECLSRCLTLCFNIESRRFSLKVSDRHSSCVNAICNGRRSSCANGVIFNNSWSKITNWGILSNGCLIKSYKDCFELCRYKRYWKWITYYTKNEEILNEKLYFLWISNKNAKNGNRNNEQKLILFPCGYNSLRESNILMLMKVKIS